MRSRGMRLLLILGVCLGIALQIPDSVQGQQKQGPKALVARGKMLVNFGGCNDCHSPKNFTDRGPVVDSSRMLSGHPADQKIPEVPPNVLGPDKWGALTTGDLTAWVGPWGTSYPANLTPDPNTGLGKWTEAMFIKTMRTGKHMGEGRNILPPMPWESVGSLPDNDLKAIFAYLRSLKPVQNAVPDPQPPAGGGQH